MAYLGTNTIIIHMVKVFAITLLLIFACQAAAARVLPQDHSKIPIPGCDKTRLTPTPIKCPPLPPN